MLNALSLSAPPNECNSYYAAGDPPERVKNQCASLAACVPNQKERELAGLPTSSLRDPLGLTNRGPPEVEQAHLQLKGNWLYGRVAKCTFYSEDQYNISLNQTIYNGER